MKNPGRRLFALLLLVATSGCAGWRGEMGTVSDQAQDFYKPDRRDYMAFRAAYPGRLLEPNYLAFMVHRFPTDSPTGDVLVFCRWPDERMPLRVHVESPVIPEELQDEFSPVEASVFVEAAQRALSRWEAELEGTVRFERADSPERADLRLSLLGERAPTPRPEIQVLGQTEALKHACRSRGWDPDEERLRVSFAVSELVVYVADDFGLLTPRQVEGVALHEIGHALGMRGHSPIESDLMYPVARDRISQHFSTQDIQSFVSLYRIPNGSHYGWVAPGEPSPRPPPGPPSGSPLLGLAPHVDSRFGFALRTPANWIGVETPNGFFAANGPLWDHDASIEVVVSPYETIEAFVERYGASLFRGTWLRHRSPMAVNGRRAVRVSVEDAQGVIAEDYTLVELEDERVMMILTLCPVSEEEAWAPWLAASLATLDLWSDPGKWLAEAPSPMSFEIRAMSVAEILDTGFQLVRSRFRDLAGIGLIVYLPFAVISLVLAAFVGPEAERLAVVEPDQLVEALPALLLIGAGSLLAYALGFPLIVAAVTALVGGVYLGRQVTLGEAMRTGLERYLPILGTFLLFGISSVVVAAGLGVTIVLTVGGVASALGGAAATLVGFFGLVVMAVLYAYVTCAYAVILQVVIFERVWAWRAILRAIGLTHGMRTRTLTVIFVATLVVLFPVVMVQIFLGSIPVFGLAALSAVQALGFAYTSCIEVVLYFELRCRKEAFDLEYLAQLVETE